ncbi:MAG: FMN-binding protein [Kordiimonas sp.]|nr:FMN-binding protein [Kordiimonas sp.]|tara:strand:- start:859 stop:1404 length:546 start_codon:yes stop_codon:yes gene_type:complete
MTLKRCHRKIIAIVSVMFICSVSSVALANDILQSPADFVNQSFGGQAPAPQVLWLTPERQAEIQKIIGRKLGVLRMRYWGRDNKTVWILDEIGKVRPITTGIVVQADKIEQLKVLIYRESHGWEVQHDFFTKQFYGQRLTSRQQLSEKVDGISGATLSVNALRRQARLALFLHGHTPYGRK